MVDVLFICVVYSRHPENSKTVKSFKNINFSDYNISPTLAVWDNSVEGYGNTSLDTVTNSDKFYFHNGKNEKLSKIYNSLIKQFSKSVRWVVILDDDSIITNEYINAMCTFFISCGESKTACIAIPKIFNDGKLISPGIIKGVRGYSLISIEDGISRCKSLVAMMSGTVLGVGISDRIPIFDERLNFYGVDTKFFKDASMNRCDIYVLPVEIEHESSLRDNNLDYNDAYPRLVNLFKSKSIIFEDVIFSKYRIKIYLLIFVIKKVIKTKDARFFKLLCL
ncbi:TPA: hypothetical protein ACSTJ2_004120 [Serratia fonticola]